ncbi:site-2 protease family protein [Novosphingobium sp.]|jgi:Zn-dependent protease|uniref:site-2 protease family protein n=1 Tax=Novosphingobium sp. TaxID=1874826 RepID=UPI0022BCBA67|nr:site-2 protease family protein [Novosphingobium sp.]MCZ8325885.1 site-2 protease family protein [Sphingomonadaceae bacterium]MCZ8019901.1 site-2 protease family protein [Novosphingobium sp.]MCZ8035773.1 site-2 protease family protein [Novosphingobium sp.]MCZ8052650.1 site-2 protease family protein [Novosphingobium sp.]MCZ8060754.1 site-2 protease family protein [Novosphingobium sp.]
MNETLFQIAALVIPLVLAIVFHEVAHGWTARALGDPTAAQLKRLSLNPFRHVDPVGTILVPGALALAKGPVFGWAKPVPVVKSRLRNPRFGMMAVAAAGPGSNLVLAAIGAMLLGLLLGGYQAVEEPSGMARFAALNLMNFITINVFLALFNLLPIPPFDGSHIVEGLLPERAAREYERLRPLGFPLVLLLIVVLPWAIEGFDPVGELVVPPVRWLTGQYLQLATWFAGG